jgi:hypothetical protein
MSLGCVRAGVLLERRAAGLSPADGLRLEEHLAGCAQCAQDAALLAGLSELSDEGRTLLDADRRSRVIGRALSAPLAPAPTARAPWALPALAVAAAVALGLFAGRALRSPEAPSSQPKQAPAALAGRASSTTAPPVATAVGDRVLGGQLVADGRTLAAGTALPAGSLTSTTGTTVALAHAEVELRPGTELDWNPQTRSLRLRAGSVVADVDPEARASFSVVTEAFSVLVLGTRFEVTLEGVRVVRGSVRVLGPGDEVLVATLGAGERFELAAHRAVEARHATATKLEPPQAGVAELLARARSELGKGHLETAADAIERASRASSRPADQAEALSLRAEHALLRRDLEAAVETYLRVARRFERLPAGQNALFAAARLEADRGRKEHALALLERYLQRYPAGRLAPEARARLRSLGIGLDKSP